MKFKFRLQPLLDRAVRERDQCLRVLASLERMKQECLDAMADLQQQQEALEEHFSRSLLGKSAAIDATRPFFSHAEALRLNFSTLNLRRAEIELAISRTSQLRQQLEFEVRRLERAHEKALAHFRAAQQVKEDRELDELGTLRYKR
ncbi:MAG: hypothetical protein AB7S38_30175 [Vulcanimicrobiota bacterium]